MTFTNFAYNEKVSAIFFGHIIGNGNDNFRCSSIIVLLMLYLKCRFTGSHAILSGPAGGVVS